MAYDKTRARLTILSRMKLLHYCCVLTGAARVSVCQRGKVSARREEAGATHRQRQSVITGSHEHGHTEGRELQDRAQEPEAEALRHREEALGDGVLQRGQQVCPRRPQDQGQPHSAPERSPHSPEVLLHSSKVTRTCYRQCAYVTLTSFHINNKAPQCSSLA